MNAYTQGTNEEWVIGTCGHLYCDSCEEEVAGIGCKVERSCEKMKETVLLSQALLEKLTEEKGGRGTELEVFELSATAAVTSSPKFDKIMEILERVPWTNDGGERVREKTIIFSQWTAALDLLSPILKREGYVFTRIDGSMSLTAREKNLIDFRNEDKV